MMAVAPFRSLRPWLAIGLLSLVTGLLGLVVPMSVSVLFDRAVPSRSVLIVIATAAVYVLLGGAIALIEFQRGRVLQWLFLGWSHGLWENLITVLSHTPLDFHRCRSAATIVTRALGVERAREALSAGALGLIVSSVVFIVSGLYLVWLQPVIGGSVLGVLGVMGAGHVVLVRRQVIRRRETAACETEEAAFVAAAVRARSAIATRQSGSHVHRHWKILHDRRIACSRQTQSLRDFQQALDLGITFWGPAAFFLVLLVSGTALSEGEVAAAYAAFGQCLLAVYTLSHASGYLVHADEGRSLYRDLTEAPQQPAGRIDVVSETGMAVEVQAVRLVFEDSRTVLENVSLAVPSATCLALVGRSGAGKSSLLRLINGVDPPSHGSVAVFGVEPARYSDETARMVFSYPTSWDAFRELVDGSDAPQLILIDELFEPIDPGLVNEALSTAKRRGLTLIAATHRHNDLAEFDRVAFLHDGKLVACAPHTQLVEQNDAYRRLFFDNN